MLHVQYRMVYAAYIDNDELSSVWKIQDGPI